MTIEIHEPELEALIQQRMDSGRFESVEDVLLQGLKALPDSEEQSGPKPPKKNFTQFMKESPLWNSGLEFERNKDVPRSVEL